MSAGEKQLPTIAWAFLSSLSVLIIDEATSSDTRTEVLVQKAMSALRSDRTSFVIVHRLSTIRDAYARLYEAQFAAPMAEVQSLDQAACDVVRRT